MTQLLIILSTHRSFSSVVSTMIGEHPDLYGFPELHLFSGDTVAQVIEREKHKQKRHSKRYVGPPGIIRTLAQIHEGRQDPGSIFRAAAWLTARRDWPSKKLFDYLLDGIRPKIGVEKSPVTAIKSKNIERAYQFYPDAYFLHLTRHPVSARKSMQEMLTEKLARKGVDRSSFQRVDDLLVWYRIQSNIVKFTDTLPVGQSMRIKGEALLSEPDVYLPQIAAWLGIRTDPDAIAAMKHPENSPFASPGTYPARGGNDPKFLSSPSLRPGTVKEPSLKAFLENESITWFPPKTADRLGDGGLELQADETFAQEVTQLANLLGYR